MVEISKIDFLVSIKIRTIVDNDFNILHLMSLRGHQNIGNKRKTVQQQVRTGNCVFAFTSMQ